MWDVDDGSKVMSTASGDDEILLMAFSRDGKHLAASSGDHTMQVWDLSSRRRIRVFRHQGPVAAVAFGSSEGHVATCSLENIAAYPVQMTDLVKLGKDRTTRVLSDRECEQHLGMWRFWLPVRTWLTGEKPQCVRVATEPEPSTHGSHESLYLGLLSDGRERP